MNQKTLDTNTWRVCQTEMETICQHSFSLFGGIRLSSVHKTQKKQDEWINAQLITSRTKDDYRNSSTINFCADLFPAHRFLSIKLKKKDLNPRASIDQTFEFLRLTFQQIKWTNSKIPIWPTSNEIFSYGLEKTIVLAKLKMFWSKLCKSNWIHVWILAFSVSISPIAAYCMERENLQYESVYFKELHNDRSTDNIQ